MAIFLLRLQHRRAEASAVIAIAKAEHGGRGAGHPCAPWRHALGVGEENAAHPCPAGGLPGAETRSASRSSSSVAGGSAPRKRIAFKCMSTDGRKE